MKTTEDVIRVPLKGGGEMIVDADVDPAILQIPWRIVRQEGWTSYAQHRAWNKGVRTFLWCHRLVVDAPKGLEVDHVNGDGLDNRRANLRLATRSQNACNSRAIGSVPYRGVSIRPDRKSRPYRVQIAISGEDGLKRVRRVGTFADPVEAARAYDTVAREVHGEFARLNFPDQEVVS